MNLKEAFKLTEYFLSGEHLVVNSLLPKEEKERHTTIHVKLFGKALHHGLFKPYNAENGDFLQHAYLTGYYPLKHIYKMVQWNIPFMIGHLVAAPISLAYFAIGLITRMLSTVISALSSLLVAPSDDKQAESSLAL